MGERMRVHAFAVAVTVLAALIAATPAPAAFPGVNGRIAYESPLGNPGPVTVDPSGLVRLRITPDCCSREPAFTPDGSRLAFVRDGNIETTDQYGSDRQTLLDVAADVRDVDWSPSGDEMVAAIENCEIAPECPTDLFVLGADGNGLTNITNTVSYEDQPSWSPDGTEIAFHRFTAGELDTLDIYVTSPQGTGEINLTATNPEPVAKPDWSPDGSKIAYLQGETHQAGRPFTMNADGTGAAAVTGTTTNSYAVVWSPDGTQLAFTIGRTIYRVPSDGGVRTEVTLLTDFDTGLDWQPLAQEPTPPPTGSGYPRPRGASPFRVPLVVAFWQCPRTGVEPNRQHAPPLAHPSCNPPVPKSGIQLGTPDYNGLPAEGIGFVRVTPLLGDPATAEDEADVRIAVSQKDVWIRKDGVLVNYAGVLKARLDLRITDKFSAGGPDASATVMDFPLVFRFQCVATPDDPAGATCEVTTTAEALLPGMVRERRRTIWGLGEVDVRFDGGRGNPNLLASDQIFLRSGVFVP